MEKVLEVNNIDEMKKIATEWFSIIPGMDKPMQVPVVQAQSLTEQEFKTKWVAKNTPCLIKGAVKNSSASKKWKDKNYWLAACSNEKNDIVTHMNYFSWKRKAEGRENVPFHEAIERLYQGNDHIFSMPARIITEDSLFAGIIKDLPQFPFLTKKKAPLWDRPWCYTSTAAHLPPGMFTTAMKRL